MIAGGIMEKASIELFLVSYAKYFEADKLVYLKEKLSTISDDRFTALTALTSELKDPSTSLILSIFLGYLGIDRFMIGDIGMGILKLVTFGACGILMVIDWFLIMDRTRQKNFDKILTILQGME